VREVRNLSDVPVAKFFMLGQRRLSDGEVVKCLFMCESKAQARELANLCGSLRDFRKCAPVSKAPNLSNEARTFLFLVEETKQSLSSGAVPLP